MTDTSEEEQNPPANTLGIAINILTSPSEAFSELQVRPRKLFPLILIVGSTIAVMFWYFTMVDFEWYIDDTIGLRDLTPEQTEAAREQMSSMSRSSFRLISTFASAIGLLAIYVLQAGYLSLTSALIGGSQKFTHWFSLVLWTGLPYIFTVIGMIVNIILSPSGQLSAYDLDPLTLANLGMQSSDSTLTTIFQTISLTMLWGMALTVMGYKHWLDCSLIKALAIVLAPYAVIFAIGVAVALS